MIHSTVRMAFPTGQLREALGILSPLAERVRVDPACLACHVYQDMQAEGVLMLEEVWRSEDDLVRHLRSNEYRNVLLVMEMALKPPEISFNTVSHSAGLETIERARR
jgi:quinol monooxygenase YgiN